MTFIVDIKYELKLRKREIDQLRDQIESERQERRKVLLLNVHL